MSSTPARTTCRALLGVRAAVAGLVDLALPARCAGCESVPGLWCPSCAATLAGPVRVRWPRPAPAGLPTPWVVADYEGAVRAAVLAHKEHGRQRLVRPLGQALARSVVAGAPAGAAVVLVPAPSRRSAIRARGHDSTTRLARTAAALVRAQGLVVSVLPVLRLTAEVDDQAGLTSVQRAANLAGAMEVPARWRGLVRGAPVLLVDDVITTGATLAEAARALRQGGAWVAGAAVIAATRRTGDPSRSVASGGLLPGDAGD